MKAKKFGSRYLIRIDRGEEIVQALKEFCKENRIRLGTIAGIGASDKVTIGLYDFKNKEYNSKELSGDYEITSLAGNITTKDDEPYIHLHATLADKGQNAHGGHLNSAVVSVTFEGVIDVIDGEAGRELDPDIGLNLIKFEK